MHLESMIANINDSDYLKWAVYRLMVVKGKENLIYKSGFLERECIDIHFNAEDIITCQI